MASVFDDAAGQLERPDLSQLTLSPQKTYTAVLNGNPIAYQISQSATPMEQVFDQLSARYSEAPLPLPAAPVLKQAPGETAEAFKQREQRQTLNRKMLAQVLSKRYLRVDAPDWGVFAAVPTPRDKRGDWTSSYVEGVKALVETGDVKVLGEAPVVLAYSGGGGATTYLSFRFQPGSNFKRLLPHPGEDMAGEDLPDVPRPEGSLRMLSFEQVHEGTPCSVHVYSWDGFGDPLGAYLDRLRGAGWILEGPASVQAGSPGGSYSLRRGTRLLQVTATRRDQSTLITLVTAGTA